MVTRDRKVIIDHDLTVGHTYEVAVRAIDSAGRMEDAEVSPRATILLSGVVTAPMAPTGLTASAFLYTVFLSWTNPTDSDFDVTEVYRSDADDRSTALKIGEVRTDTFADNLGASDLTRYYWIRSRNTSGVQGDWNAYDGTEAVTEKVTATDIDDFAVTATKLYTDAIVLTGAAWTNNSPGGGYIAWNAHTLVYNGASYAISAGNTNAKYVYWIAGGTSYSVNADHPTLRNGSFMIATNDGGYAQQVWNSSANMVIGTAFILDLAVTNAKIANLAVSNAKIDDCAVSKLTAGTITSKSINLAVSGGTGDVEIRTGIASGDFANAGAAAGFILGCDDSDSDKAKFYIGDASKFLKWDGAVLTVQGLIQTAASGKRVVLDNTSNNLYMYNSAGSQSVAIGSDTFGGTTPSIVLSNATYGGVIDLVGGTHEDVVIDKTGIAITKNSNSVAVYVDNYASTTGDSAALMFAKFEAALSGVLFCGMVGSTTVFRAHSDGTLDITGSYKVAGNQVVGAQGAHVADATAVSGTATSGGYGFVSAAEMNTAITNINTIKTQLNLLISRLETHGLIASA